MATCLTSNEVCNIDRVCRSSGIGACTLGDTVCGGILIHKYGGGHALIIAPSACTFLRRWYEINTVVTNANNNLGYGDWYIPSCSELQLIGSNRTYLDACGYYYWSSTPTCSSSDTAPIERSWVWIICTNEFTRSCVRTCCSTLVRARAVRTVYY